VPLSSRTRKVPLSKIAIVKAEPSASAENTRMATVAWQDTPGPYSYWGGSINQLPNSNVEFDMSAPFPAVVGSRVLEVTQTDMPQTVWQMDIRKGHAYRAYRITSLYPGVSWK